MTLFQRIIDNRNKESYSAQMRRKRFGLFLQLISNLPKPINALDIGGTQDFWVTMGFVDNDDVNITLLNLKKPTTSYKNFVGVAGDATNISQFDDNQFDVVFSNSVIEHLYTFDNQKRMAQEVQRVGRHHFVQTPNYFFPIEPHFLFVGFQWLPISTRVFLLSHFDLGWRKK